MNQLMLIIISELLIPLFQLTESKTYNSKPNINNIERAKYTINLLLLTDKWKKA